MSDVYTVALSNIIDEFKLEVICAPDNLDEILISDNDLNRPGLQLKGFYEYFNSERIQVCGNMEFAFLGSISPEERREAVSRLFETKIPHIP